MPRLTIVCSDDEGPGMEPNHSETTVAISSFDKDGATASSWQTYNIISGCQSFLTGIRMAVCGHVHVMELLGGASRLRLSLTPAVGRLTD